MTAALIASMTHEYAQTGTAMSPEDALSSASCASGAEPEARARTGLQATLPPTRPPVCWRPIAELAP